MNTYYIYAKAMINDAKNLVVYQASSWEMNLRERLKETM